MKYKLLEFIPQKQIELQSLTLYFIRDLYWLFCMFLVERMEDLRSIKEDVQEIKKCFNEERETKAILKGNG